MKAIIEIALIVIIVTVVALRSCGDDSVSNPPPGPPPSLVFLPEIPPAGTPAVTLALNKDKGTPSTVVLDVKVANIPSLTPAFGAAFDLTFDLDVVTFSFSKPTFTILYDGSGDTATMTITATTLTITTEVAEDDLSRNLADFPSLRSLVDFLDALPVYEATAITPSLELARPVNLDVVTNQDIKTAAIQVTAHPPDAFLEKTGTVASAAVLQSDDATRVVVGASQTFPDPGASGDGTLMTLTFSLIGSGSSKFAFKNEALLAPGDQDGDGRADVVPGVTWHGGTLTVP